MRLDDVLRGLSSYLIQGATENHGWGNEVGKYKEANPLNTGEVICGLLLSRHHLHYPELPTGFDVTVHAGIQYLIKTQLESKGWATGSAYLAEHIDTKGNIVSTCWAIWAMCEYLNRYSSTAQSKLIVQRTVLDALDYLSHRVDSLWAYSPDLKEPKPMATAYGIMSLAVISSSSDVLPMTSQEIMLLKTLVLEALEKLDSQWPSPGADLTNILGGSIAPAVSSFLFLALKKISSHTFFKNISLRLNRMSDSILEYHKHCTPETMCISIIERQAVVEAGKKARDFIHYAPAWSIMVMSHSKRQFPQLQLILESLLHNIDQKYEGASHGGDSKRFTWSSALTLMALSMLVDEMELLNLPVAPKKENAMSTNPKKVFVVHGRNKKIREAMFTFLRSLNLEPIEWEQAVHSTGSGAPTISTILDLAFSEAQAVVVLLTGDDEARLRQKYATKKDPLHERNLTPQARPNVIFEAGLAFGRNPDRTILIQVGKARPFSDVAGRHIIYFSGTPEDRQILIMRLKTAGCIINQAVDWLTAGSFN